MPWTMLLLHLFSPQAPVLHTDAETAAPSVPDHQTSSAYAPADMLCAFCRIYSKPYPTSVSIRLQG